jgi:O-acetyl-ADP-ribose deacetylase (regulator of RNase III)
MIELIQGDITKMQVDAIVNAANSTLLGGGGVDGAIHRAAGPQLREYNVTLGGCNTGEAKLSPGFSLPANYVISTVGPVWHDGEQGEAELLANSYRNALKLALQHHIRSIAFPAISTGVYGYPKRQAAAIALEVMRQFEQQFERIVVVTHGDEDTQIYRDLI